MPLPFSKIAFVLVDSAGWIAQRMERPVLLPPFSGDASGRGGVSGSSSQSGCYLQAAELAARTGRLLRRGQGAQRRPRRTKVRGSRLERRQKSQMPRGRRDDLESFTCLRSRTRPASLDLTSSCLERSRCHVDPVYMSRKIRKFRTDKFDT